MSLIGNELFREWGATSHSPLATAVLEREKTFRDPVIDLITANPNANGFQFSTDLLTALIQEAAQRRTVGIYSPDALGQVSAREAIARYYRDGTRSGAVVLTPGTSMGYFYALRLLTNPGDEVLIPKPGYPLLDDLAKICGVTLRNYHLKNSGADWALDLDDLEFQITPRTRAVVVVSAHNPTGSTCSAEDLRALGEICRRHNLPVLFDEVFCEFLHDPSETFARPMARDFPLVITLNGLSKMLSLPAWKIAWMKINGDEQVCSQFMRAVEHAADTFLPVNELAQAMVELLLTRGEGEIVRFANEYRERMNIVRKFFPRDVPSAGGGVYACLRLPEGMKEDEVAMRLIREQGVLVHPGHFYGLSDRVVLTAVAERELLTEGLARVSSMIS